MNRSGAAPQTMRNTTNPGFPSQQQQQGAGRGMATGSNRIVSSRIASTGNVPGWGGAFGAPSLSSASRTNPSITSSFAQTLGGQQSSTSLDPSEFPSLSGTPQSQQSSNVAQSLWANSSIRAPQNPPVRPPSQQSTARSRGGAPAGNPPLGPDPLQSFGARGGGQDFDFGGQIGTGQLPGLGQPQTGNIEEFPPLGDLGGVNPVQEQQRRGNFLPSGTNGILNSNARSSLDGGSSATGGLGGDDGNNLDSRTSRNASNSLSQSQQQQQLPLRNLGFADAQSTNRTHDDTDGSVGSPSGAQTLSQIKSLAQMSELDRYGLPGLVAVATAESPDHNALATGQDLTALGLDLNKADGSPLYPHFATPFNDAARPIVPEFRLPADYKVPNVPHIFTKLLAFSDETLFAIFYQYPRDMLQELAAEQLWRWHKVLRQWMMRDDALPVQRVSEHEERGYYVFFNVHVWDRERRDFLLDRRDWDQRHLATAAAAAAAASAGGAGGP